MPVPAGPPRRFTLLDAMILVALTAIGIAIVRAARDAILFIDVSFDGSSQPGGLAGLAAMLRPVVRGMVPWCSVLVLWTLAVPALRLRQPRPARRRLLAPPGVAACCVALVMLAFEGAGIALRHAMYPLPRVFDLIGADTIRSAGFEPYNWVALAMQACLSRSIGFGVAALWIWMALAGRWRPEPYWLDRMGRALGVAWLLVVPLWLWLDVFG